MPALPAPHTTRTAAHRGSLVEREHGRSRCKSRTPSRDSVCLPRLQEPHAGIPTMTWSAQPTSTKILRGARNPAISNGRTPAIRRLETKQFITKGHRNWAAYARWTTTPPQSNMTALPMPACPSRLALRRLPVRELSLNIDFRHKLQRTCHLRRKGSPLTIRYAALALPAKS